MSIALIIFIIWYYRDSLFSKNSRSQRMRIVAGEIKMSFSLKGDNAPQVPVKDFFLFSRGGVRSMRNVMNGNFNGVNVSIFDYSYYDRLISFTQTVILFVSPDLRVPHFSLVPLRPPAAALLNTLFFSNQAIEYDLHPGFSSEYKLVGQDEIELRKAITEELISYYENNIGLYTEGDDNQLIFYRLSKMVSSNNIREFFKEGCHVFKLLTGKELL